MFSEQIKLLKENTDVRKVLIDIKASLKDKEQVEKFRNSKGYSKELLIGLLSNEDAKARKATAAIMGAVIEVEFLPLLYKAYCEETVRFVKCAYLQAMADYDYSGYMDELRARIETLESSEVEEDEVKHVAEELKALRKLVPDSVKAEKHVFCNPSKPVQVVLTTKKELVQMLMEKVEGGKAIFCGVMTATDKITALSKIRVYKDLLFPLNNMRPIAKKDLANVIACGNLVELLELMHEKSKAAFRFRVSGKDLDLSMLSGKIEALSRGRLCNSVSDYEIEIKLLAGKEENYLAFLQLHTMNNNRFAYRKEHVAASIHPVNAAIVAELTSEYMKKDAQILDPCCGVGTMLIERNKIVPAKHIYGVDVFGVAIQGARVNAKAAHADINFINRDYFDFTHEYLFDEIISNLPDFKSRTETDSFYEKFFAKSKEMLKADGIMIITCCEKNLVKKHIRLNDSFKLLREFTLSEKEGREIFVIKKS